MNYIKTNFYLAFIYDSRWKLFVKGFGMTVLLTISSFVLGSLLAVLLCRFKMSKNKIVKKITELFIGFLIQIPTLVLLMICAYLIFVKTPLPITVMAIIGLTLKTSAYLCDIYYTALESLNKGEAEAGLAMGMTKIQVFWNITFPQAVKAILPVYKNQLVLTLQETSVVGYVAILDLTRASEIVSSRTFDAFFSLITITIFYMLLGKVLRMLLDFAKREKHIDENDLKRVGE